LKLNLSFEMFPLRRTILYLMASTFWTEGCMNNRSSKKARKRKQRRTDVFSKSKRSEVMSKIRGKNTKPELAVRSILHRMGYRFRLHRRDLPGCPDIVLPKYKTVIFVHGCFWHRHPKCKYAYNPKSRKTFWQKKFRQNVEQDKKVRKKLTRLGWKVIVIWECEIKNLNKVIRLVHELQR